jgi:hypothetical protein
LIVRLISMLLIAALAVAGFVGIAYYVVPGEPGPSPLPAQVDPLLPDLTMGPITDLAATVGEDGREQLRFAATIVNVGSGDFLLRVRRSTPFADWTVYQQIEEAAGGVTEEPTEARAIYGGDNHDHWHIAAVESHRLIDLASDEVVGELVKQGFCFFDTDRVVPDLPGTPDKAFYHASGCGKPWDVRLAMGLSVGWGDEYPWSFLDQRIYVDDLPAGRYRIIQTADRENLFEEADEENNETWIDIELSRQDGYPVVTVLDQAPAPGPSS